MNDWYRADVSAEYAVGLLQWLEQRRIPIEDVLVDTGIGPAQLEGNLRLTTQQDAALLANAISLAGDPGMGFELGLRATLTWHGLLGLGLMSCATLGQALELWAEYLDLRTAGFCLSVQKRDGRVELHIQDLSPGAPMRRSALERLATMTACLGGQLTQQPLPELEMWFTDDQPAYFARYRHRLAQTRYGTGMCMVRMPDRYLDLPIPTANALVLRQVKAQCESERLKHGQNDCLIARIKNLLPLENGTYPGMEDVAQALCMSSRTLKRKLRQLGLNFRQLIDDARKNEVLRDVLNTAMTIDEIAERRGYSDAANLTRAFRRWTGESPSQYRAKLPFRLERAEMAA
ncbi:AraC family transcriptional regulator [Dyella caseinilytica]|uniref:AraC family transcriptional regulator n=1 Tax=Dyella caseinilytica TaxID=1849581 RepID=A0ABX7H0A0_9GAMM|nr:AraC family transcriptional regulator [Dyella caseinilytica]QRN55636.1 AraC family transcriptional regulator [Dyella caseinilytica]GGA03314.1 AraC family transcriptional regulator [Dyella caseinilytica]